MTTDAEARAVATAALGAWEQTFNRHDLDALVDLYAETATLFGSKADLFSGRKGVRAYFTQVRPGFRAAMGDGTATEIAPGVILTAGFVDFSAGDEKLPFRLTMVLVRAGSRWLIAQHHSSPRADVTQTSSN